jgi:hypothetical protein
MVYHSVGLSKFQIDQEIFREQYMRSTRLAIHHHTASTRFACLAALAH